MLRVVVSKQNGHLLRQHKVHIVESDDPLGATLDGNEQQKPSWTKKPEERMSRNVPAQSVRNDLAKQS